MQKPKICFVSPKIIYLLTQNSHLNSVGGAELQQLIIGKELVRRGYGVSFVTMNLGQEEIEGGNSFRVIPTFKPKEGIPIIRFFFPRLVKIWQGLSVSGADIYYVRCAGYLLAPVVLFAKLNKKKVIFWGGDDTDFDPKRVQLPIFRDRMMHFWGLKRCDCVIVQNKIQQKLLRENFNISAPIIHNGFFKTSHMSSLKEEILWVSNFKKKKNPHIFIELAKRIPNEKFVMIGGIDTNATVKKQENCHYIVEKAKKVPNLNLKGILPLEDVEKRFMRAKLFINTSEHEGFPNTFLQAWSRGIPVISFVDPDDLIKKYHLGLVVKDFDEMTQKVKDILDKKITFSSQKIRAFFENNLTIEKIVDKYEELFKAVNM